MDLKAVSRGWETQREFSYWVPEPDIEGCIPRDLHGTFIRNGPGIHEIYGKKLKHAIDGDGMVCKISVCDGKVHFQNKFVKSKHRLEEEKNQRFMYPGQMGTRDKALVKDTLAASAGLLTGKLPKREFRNPSNTNAFYWGGKILSLYETHLPHCLDPYTLETLGLDDLNRCLTLGNAGVHYRIDPHTMNLVLFSLRPGFNRPPRLQVHEFDKQWQQVNTLNLSIEGFNYAHDFLLLPDYYVFHITPFTDLSSWTVFKILAGWTSPGESFRYFSHLPSKFAVIPRNAASVDDVILVDVEPCHIYHFGTGEQQGSTIRFSCVCMDKDFDMEFAHRVWLSNFDVSPGYMFDVTIDLNTRTCTRTKLATTKAEFPASHPYRHGVSGTKFTYLMASEREESLPLREVVKLDTRSGAKDVWYSDGVIGEPVFAPRNGYQSSVEGDEDDGYLLVQLYHPHQHRTDFCILDAKEVAKGPIARIKLKHHVPFGFHGTYTPEVFLHGQYVAHKSKL